MTQNDPQVPWTDEQWARVTQVVQEEANRARVAATFLPLRGPLPPDSDFVRKDEISYEVDNRPELAIDDKAVIQLATLQVKLFLRGPQMGDPEMTSALAMFRRAANVLARLEDVIIFNGQPGPNMGPQGIGGLPPIWQILGGQESKGLLTAPNGDNTIAVSRDGDPGGALVEAISNSIGRLEYHGHFGPFAVALGNGLFTDATTPSDSLVLPLDRIIPFLGGGSVVRSSTLPEDKGVVVALGAAPVELVVATDVTVNFLQMTTDPKFVFRVHEKIVLRIKEPTAIVRLN